MAFNHSPPPAGTKRDDKPDFLDGSTQNGDPPSTDLTPPHGSSISFAYNVPDAFETDHEIIRSEVMFYNTPLTEKYSEQVYGAVQNLQSQCAADFQRVCPTSTPYMNLNRLMAQLMVPMEDQRMYRGRRLTSAELRTGADYVDYLRSFYSPIHMLQHGHHPLSAVVRLDETTGNLVGHGKKDDKEIKRSRNAPVGEGRKAAPGWKMPDTPGVPATATTDAAPVAQEKASVPKLSSVPRSHAAPAHHHHEHRHLRDAAPGWTPPPSVFSRPAEPLFLESLPFEEDTPAVAPPCAKPFQGPVDQEQSGVEEVAGPPVFRVADNFNSDFRSFLMDFLTGRDVSLSLVLPYSVVLDPARHIDTQEGEGEGDEYYSYYSGEDAAYAYFDDDGANYAYEDTPALDDDAEIDADEGENGKDDDDFFAQRFDLPLTLREALAQQARIEQAGRAAVRCGTSAVSEELSVLDTQPYEVSGLSQRAFVAKRQAFGQTHESNGLFFLRGGPGPHSSEDEGESGSSEEEHRGDSSEEEGDHHGPHHSHDGPERRLVRPHSLSQGPAGQKGERPPPPGPRDGPPGRPHGPGGPDQHDEDHGHGHHDHHRHGSSSEEEHHHGPPPPEDHSFSGNLGFGADGDMCLYRGMAQGRVSQPCLGAVSDLYELRAEYWQESQQDRHHHGLGLLIIGVLMLVYLVRRIYAARYEKKVRSLLTAIHTHPHLKASIEAETGVEIPTPVPASCCVRSECDKSVLARACKVAIFATCIFAVSVAVSYSALEITMNIVNAMDKHAPEDPNTGEVVMTSPFAALVILFMVCTAELTVVVLAVRGVKYCIKRRQMRAAMVSADSGVSPSAPFEGRSGRGGLSQSAQQVWLSLPTANLFGRLRGGRARGSGDGYAVLLSEEDREDGGLGRSSHGAAAGTEMVSVNMGMGAYPAHYTPQASAPQAVHAARQYAPAGPVTARPVNAISMV